jgi:Arc/MetJ-type ribon-helix-helix transcriptional regulator
LPEVSSALPGHLGQCSSGYKLIRNCQHVLATAGVLQIRQARNTLSGMETLTVRLPQALAQEIEAESKARKISKSDVVRERLQRAAGTPRRRREPLAAIADLIGSVDRLPADLSAQRKRNLKATGYGRKRPR